MKKARKIVLTFGLVMAVFLSSINNVFGQEGEGESPEITDRSGGGQGTDVSENAVENSDGAPALSRFKIYSIPENAVYYSGETVLFYAGLSLTDESGAMVDAILELTVPKENIVEGTFDPSDIDSQVLKEEFEEDGFYKVRYTLKPVAAGTSIDIPFKFVTKNGATPNGFQIPVTAEIFTEQEGALIDPISQTFTIKTYKPSVEKLIHNQSSWTFSNNNTVIAGEEDINNLGYLTNELAGLVPVEFSFYLSHQNTAYGNRLYDKVIVRDTIPEGAVFLEEDNPGWQYDDESRTATFVYENEAVFLLSYRYFYNDVKMKLRFPGQKNESTFTNKMEVEVFPRNMKDYESSTISSDSIQFKIIKKEKPTPPGSFSFYKSVDQWEKYDYEVDRQKDVTWSVTVANIANKDDFPDLNLENVVIKDYELGEELQYKSISYTKTDGLSGAFDISVRFDDGQEEVVASNLDLGQSHRIMLENKDQIASILISFKEGSIIKPGKRFVVAIGSELRDKDAPLLESGTNKYIYNSASVSANYTEGQTLQYVSSYNVRFNKVSPVLSIEKSTPYVKDRFINDSVPYTLSVRQNNFLAGTITTELTQIVDLLPVGLEYLKNTATLSVDRSTIFESEMKSGKFEPDVIHNYRNTGRTALVWELKPYMYKGSKERISSRLAVEINYETKITKLTMIGSNKNDVYLAWKNNEELKPNYPTADVFDLNKNGSTDDKISKATATINYVPPRELIIQKSVMGSEDANLLLPPSEGVSEIGSETTHRFTIFNNSMIDVEHLTVLDLLPDVGDLTVSTDVTFVPPKRVERETTFPLKLAKPIEVPEGFKVFYTTADPHTATDMKAFSRSDIWEEEVSDISKITALKIEMLPGQVLKSGEIKHFDAVFQVPANPKLTVEDKAVNTFAVATTAGLNFVESNFSTTRITRYKVEGVVFNDLNKDNIHNEGDEVFTQKTVALLDMEGKPVLGLDNKPLVTKTDDSGNYHFDVYHKGEYQVHVETPKNFKITEPSSANEEYFSHIMDEGQGLSTSLTLDRNNPEAIRNAGYYQVALDVTATKVWVEGPELKPSIAIQLYQNGEKYGDAVELQDGKIDYTWESLPLVDEAGVNYVYTVDELDVPENYQKTIEGTTITNTYVSPKREFTVEKVWVNGPNKHPTISLQLYRNGETYGEVKTLSDGEVSLTWRDLDETDLKGVPYVYTVDELEVPKNYGKVVEGLTVTNTYSSPKIEITAKKVWIGGADQKPPIELQLYRNGETFGEPVLLQHGIDSTTWEHLDKTDSDGVDYQYTIDEVATPQGYRKVVEGFTITNIHLEQPPEIIDPDYPQPSQVNLPKTGQLNAWAVAVCIMGVGLALIYFGKKKRS